MIGSRQKKIKIYSCLPCSIVPQSFWRNIPLICWKCKFLRNTTLTHNFNTENFLIVTHVLLSVIVIRPRKKCCFQKYRWRKKSYLLLFEKRKHRFVRISLQVENHPNRDFHWPNVCHYWFTIWSLTWTQHYRSQNYSQVVNLKKHYISIVVFLRFTKCDR